jgi:hypothetical protein
MNRIARVFVLLASPAFTSEAFARGGRESFGGSHAVRGYVTKTSTYVALHCRTGSNAARIDNWSTKATVNPYTGSTESENSYAA